MNEVAPFPIPEQWCWATAGDLIEHIEAGKSFKCLERTPDNSEVGVVKVSAVTWGTYNENESKTCTTAANVNPDLYVRHGDFLFSRANTIELVGACVIADGITKNVMLSDKILRFHVTEGWDRWLMWALRSLHGRDEIQRLATGNQDSMRNIGQARIRQIRLPLAPSSERSKVVEEIDSYFSRLDDTVATLQRVQRNLKRYRASVLKAAVEGRLVPTEAELARKEGRDYEPADVLLARILKERKARWLDQEAEKARAKAEVKARKAGKTWTKADNKAALENGRATATKKYKEPEPPDTSKLPELPEGWCWATVDQLLAQGLANGRSVPTAKQGFPVLRLTALKGDLIDLAERKIGSWSKDEATPYLVQLGDILVARGNGSIRLVGRGGMVTVAPDAVAYPDTMIRIRLIPNLVNSAYFTNIWNSRVVRNSLEKRAKTTAGIYKVNQQDLGETCIPLPPLAEQERLVASIELNGSIAEANGRTVSDNLGRCTRLRQSILKWAFEGKLVDQDPDDEPATVLLERIKAEREAAQADAKKNGKPARRKKLARKKKSK